MSAVIRVVNGFAFSSAGVSPALFRRVQAGQGCQRDAGTTKPSEQFRGIKNCAVIIRNRMAA